MPCDGIVVVSAVLGINLHDWLEGAENQEGFRLWLSERGLETSVERAWNAIIYRVEGTGVRMVFRPDGQQIIGNKRLEDDANTVELVQPLLAEYAGIVSQMEVLTAFQETFGDVANLNIAADGTMSFYVNTLNATNLQQST